MLESEQQKTLLSFIDYKRYNTHSRALTASCKRIITQSCAFIQVFSAITVSLLVFHFIVYLTIFTVVTVSLFSCSPSFIESHFKQLLHSYVYIGVILFLVCVPHWIFTKFVILYLYPFNFILIKVAIFPHIRRCNSNIAASNKWYT